MARSFRAFAKYAGRDGAPGYADICAHAERDPEMLGLLACAPPPQRRPTLLLASVHYLLLTGVQSPLADVYPTLAARRRDGAHVPGGTSRWGPARTPEQNRSWYPAFSEFCRIHRRRIEELLATRATQTNEIGRCSALLPALCTVARRHAPPLAVVDLGCSAGLNLLFDRYAYSYAPSGVGPHAATTGGGDPASPVRLDTTLLAGTLPDLTMPVVAWRSGIDQSPVDPTDNDAAQWLLACQWPEHPERFSRLKEALALARSGPAPPVITGDLVDGLGQLVAAVPSDTHLCVTHTWVAAYLPVRRQLDLSHIITDIAATRPVSWVFAEEPFESPGLPVPPSPDPQPGRDKGATAVVVLDADGTRTHGPWRVADMHPHGRWLRWWGIR
ncbi:MAG: DUF2332 domain-containing protein [Acidimicrobiales bacterium]